MSSRKNKVVVHRIFELCKPYTPDNGWKEFLSECSRDKFPTGIKFVNNILISSRKKNTFQEELPKDPVRALATIIEIFRDRLGIKTLKERTADDLNFKMVQQAKLAQKWSDVRTIGGKSSLLAHYATKLSIYYGMNDMEAQNCLGTLKLGLATKILNKTNIDVVNGSITNIKVFYFDEVLRVCGILGKSEPIIPFIEERSMDFVPVKQMGVFTFHESIINEHIEKMVKALET
jgi:hypothetical protein